MFVVVNGERRETQATDIRALLRELEYEGDHLAVAVNLRVVPRTRWSEVQLASDDTIEVLTPRQGG